MNFDYSDLPASQVPGGANGSGEVFASHERSVSDDSSLFSSNENTDWQQTVLSDAFKRDYHDRRKEFQSRVGQTIITLIGSSYS